MKTKTKLALAFVAILVVIRILAPAIILKKLNAHLAGFSPVYFIHIADLDLSLIRGAYRFEGVTAQLKEKKTDFLSVEKIDVSVAWRELFRGRILTDIDVEAADFTLSRELIEGSRAPTAEPEAKARDAAATLFPVRIERIVIRDSSFHFAQLMGDPEGKQWRISSIEGSVVNFTSTPNVPFALYSLNGTVLDSSSFKAVGKLNRQKTPMQWELDAEIREFDLVAANPILKRQVPFTFTKGKLDAFAEVISVDGKMKGYIKPFFKKVDVVANKEKFVSLKHFAVEIIGALANLVMRKSDDKSTAVRVPFATGPDGGLKVETSRILPTAIQYGFDGGLQPGIEDQINLERN